MNYFEYTELENIIGQKRAAAKHLKNNNILYGQKGAELNMISVIGKHFTPHWSQTVSPFQSAQTQAPLMPIHNDESEPASTDWAQARLDSFSFLSDSPGSTQQQETQSKPLSKNTQQRMVQAMQCLLSKSKMSPEAAAGVIGVFMAESGLTPGKYNESERELYGELGGGRGLAQWTNVGKKNGTGRRRDAYEAFLNGRTPTLELDLDFFLKELQSRPKVLAILNNPDSTIEDAVYAMHRGYENGTFKAFATPEQMGSKYTKAWAKNPYITRKYDFNESEQTRFRLAQQAYKAYKAYTSN